MLILLLWALPGLALAQQAASESAPENATTAMDPKSATSNQINSSLEPRMSDKNFIADILNRLHSLDADIGKLLFNSSSMYAADDQSDAFRQYQPKGGERFTEVLGDLDALQDEVSTASGSSNRVRPWLVFRLETLAHGILN